MPQASDPKQTRDLKASTTPKARPKPAQRPRASEHAQAPGDPVVPADPRTRWIGIALVGAAAVIAFIVTIGIFLPAIGELTSGGRTTRADPAALPGQILVCGREYAAPEEPALLTLSEVRSREGRDPTVVSAAADAGCPSGACIEGGMCLTVVYVRTTDDRYIAYELQEGS